MNARQAKKLRQQYRRDLRAKIDEDIKDFQSQVNEIIKPAPRFFPAFLWVALQKLFLNT